jgi:hypothetical protein
MDPNVRTRENFMANKNEKVPISNSASRRRFLKQVGVYGAALAAGPLALTGRSTAEGASETASASNRASSNASTQPTENIFLPDPQPLGKIEYINPNPPAFKDPEYAGEYYEAVVPATLDLAERARLAIHGMTSMVNPHLDYEMYFIVNHMSQPPSMDLMPSDLDTQGKFIESTALMRIVCGSKENLHVDRVWMEMLLKMQGPDGILYTPMSGRDWVMYSKMERGSGSPSIEENPTKQFCLLGFGTARSLGALSIFAQLDPGGPWKKAAHNLAHAYEPLMINKGDNESYLFSPWMYPGRPIDKTIPNPIVDYSYVASYQAWIAQYLAMYDRAFHDPASTQLAERIMNYSILDRQLLEPSGRFLPAKGRGHGSPDEEYAHFHTAATNILACLYVYMQTGNKTMLDRGMKAYEYGKAKSEPLVGFIPEFTAGSDPYLGSRTSETCEVADMVVAALMLAKFGNDSCWDDADRWIRNQLAENQLTQVAWLKDGHLNFSRSETPADFFKSKRRTTDNVAERSLGGFAGWPSANDWVSNEDWWGDNKQNIVRTIQNCCTASGARAIFAAWRDMLNYDHGTLKVNLLFNRASKWADIDSYIPYTGRVELKIKQPLELEVRIPEWVKPGEAKCEVDGKTRKLGFDGRYAQAGKVVKGQTVAITFPISERTEKRRIEKFDYTFVVRGNDVVDVDPPGKYCPYYQRAHYRTGKPLYQKTIRFVAREELAWW